LETFSRHHHHGHHEDAETKEKRLKQHRKSIINLTAQAAYKTDLPNSKNGSAMSKEIRVRNEGVKNAKKA